MDTKELARTKWVDLAERWIELVNNGPNVHREGLLDSWMLDAVGEVSGLAVIDLGCGEGRFSRMLTERSAKVTGLDLCEPLIAHAKAHRVKDEVYVTGDMENLSAFADRTFDLAVSYLTLGDVYDYRRAVVEAYRVVRPGGRFIASNLGPMISSGRGWLKRGRNKLHHQLDDYFD